MPSTDALRLPLLTERLEIRPLTRHDVTSLCRIGGRPEVARMMTSVPSPWPAEDARAWVEQSQWRGRLGFRLGICLRGGELVGIVGMGGEPPTVAYFLDPAYWGQGMATEAMRAFLDFCFRRFELAELFADHFADNPGSGRVLRKLGYEEIGRGTAGSAGRTEEAENVEYRVTEAQFRAALRSPDP
ncbi:GNAT family N-acetyltransferase [Algicella marina]|uniref:GNAT family N-acetyltransferase n=1 Tax=Algicella marina TaxID=2683284 RepID=UPI00137A0EEF|nr:GNAT family N-acetyltransferase [Algicella marina]